MAIPSGSGTEVLKNTTHLSQSNTTVSALTCPANSIITVLNCIISHDINDVKSMEISMSPGGSGDVHLLRGFSLPNYGSFVWRDKLVLHPADILKVYSDSTNFDIYINYILQDYT